MFPQNDQSQDPPQMPSPAAPQGAPPNLQAMMGQPQAPPPQDPPQMPVPGSGGVNPALQAILGQPAANPVNPIIEQLQQSAQQARDRAAARQSFLKQLMTTDALGKYLPKPTAGQMLSDALTNFGMARLTNGEFTPIQLKRYDEAFKRHQADIQNAQTMLQSDRQDELDSSNSLSHYLMAQKQADTVANYHAKITEAQDERARKQAATKAAIDFKNAQMNLVQIPKMKTQTEKDAAMTDFIRTRDAIAANGGGNEFNAAAAYMNTLAEAGQLPSDPAEQLKIHNDALEAFRNSSKFKPSDPAGVQRLVFDMDNKPFGFNGRTGEIKPLDIPEGAAFGKMSQPAKTNLSQIKSAYGLASDLRNLLDTTMVRGDNGKLVPIKEIGNKDLGEAIGASATARLNYQQYIRGIGNTNNIAESLGMAKKVVDVQPDGTIRMTGVTGDPRLDKIIQYAALLKIMGSAPLIRGVRAMPFITQIQTHLPDEKTNTPALMSEKLDNLMPQWQAMSDNIIEGEAHPVSGNRLGGPPSSSRSSQKPDAPPAVGGTFNGEKVKKVTRLP